MLQTNIYSCGDCNQPYSIEMPRTNSALPLLSPDEWTSERQSRAFTVGDLLLSLFPTGTDYRTYLEEVTNFGPTRPEDNSTSGQPNSGRRRNLPVTASKQRQRAAGANYKVKRVQPVFDAEFQNRLAEFEYKIDKLLTKPKMSKKQGQEKARFARTMRQLWRRAAFRRAPCLPPDLFGAVGLLLDLSGACHHVYGITDRDGLGRQDLRRPLRFGPGERNRAIRVAEEWRSEWTSNNLFVPQAVQDAWTSLLSAWEDPIFLNLPVPLPGSTEIDTALPPWWHHALFLFVVCDEASRNIGFPGIEPLRTERYRTQSQSGPSRQVSRKRVQQPTPPENKSSALEIYYDTLLAIGRFESWEGQAPGGLDRSKPKQDALYTIANIPADLACVLPKSRTAQVGCTIRSLSHNLAILPSRGRARARWYTWLSKLPWDLEDDLHLASKSASVMFNANEPRRLSRAPFPLRSTREPLNLLLIPYPYEIPQHSFRPSQTNDGESHQSHGSFTVDPVWGEFTHSSEAREEGGHEETRRVILELVQDLTERARQASGPVHGIVFPELALSFEIFEHLIHHIAMCTRDTDLFASIDFLVAGLRSNDDGRPGNFAGTAIFAKVTGDAERVHVVSTQEKHHRWRLDRNQVAGYGLAAQLSTGMLWWEDIELLSRSLNVFVVRDCATIAPLICEDLARLEPIHELVRSIGPNLIIALLMDGAQLETRWSGRYALGLSEDPGCSVLTLTSFGLIDRALAQDASRFQSRSVGLWRNDSGQAVQLKLSPGQSAIVLSLGGENTEEITLDGRADGAVAVRWIYGGHTAIEANAQRFPWARARLPRPSVSI